MFYYFFLAIYVQHPKFQRNKIISLFLDCVHTKDIPEDVLNTYCWIHSTYTIPSAFWKRIGKDHCKYSYIVSIEMWNPRVTAHRLNALCHIMGRILLRVRDRVTDMC